MNSVKSNSTSANPVWAFCAVYLLIVKKLNPVSSELNPSPIELNFCIPSTYIWSPTAKGGGLLLKPSVGVTKAHVTTPVILVVEGPTTVWMENPLLLLVAKIEWVNGFKPFGKEIILTSVIEFPVISGSIAPVLTTCFVSGSTITKIGSLW